MVEAETVEDCAADTDESIVVEDWGWRTCDAAVDETGVDEREGVGGRTCDAVEAEGWTDTDEVAEARVEGQT